MGFYDGACARIDLRQGVTRLPRGLAAGDVAGASLAALTDLEAKSFGDAFAFSAAGTVERVYQDAGGVLRNDLAADAPRFDFSAGVRQLLLEAALTNKCTCAKQNPPDTTNCVAKGSGTTTVVAVASLPTAVRTALAASPLSALVDGAVYRTQAATANNGVIVQGATGDLNPHTAEIWAYVASGAAVIQLGSAGTGASALAAGGWTRKTIANVTPASTTDSRVTLQSSGGAVDVYWVLPGLYEQAFAPAWPIPGTAAAAVTRPIETARFSPLVEALAQRAAGTIVARGRALSRTAGVLLGGAGSDALLMRNGGSGVRANKTASLDATFGSGTWAGAWGAALAWDSGVRRLAADGGSVASDANGPGDRSTLYAGRNGGNTAFGDCFFDEIVLFPTDIGSAALQLQARAYAAYFDAALAAGAASAAGGFDTPLVRFDGSVGAAAAALAALLRPRAAAASGQRATVDAADRTAAIAAADRIATVAAADRNAAVP